MKKFLLPLLLFSSVATSGEVLLKWEPPTTNDDEDKTPLTDLAGYYVYYGNESGFHDVVFEISDESLDSYVLKDLDPGEYYFIIKAYDTSGNISKPSNEPYKALRTPSPPSNIR